MKINLDKIEQTAKAAQADTRYPSWAHARLGGNARTAEHIATCSPDVVLAMVGRIRELEYRAQYVDPVYLAAKRLHQLTDKIDDTDLGDALDASYGKL